jgi:hypothetical protein
MRAGAGGRESAGATAAVLEPPKGTDLSGSLSGPALNRVPLDVSRIIPGDWGKAGSGWLVRPL